jgi:protein-tyrosine phosphatase
MPLGTVHQDDRNLILHYRDGESLTEEMIKASVSFLSGTRQTLVHCAAGQTRSPTLAMLGKLIRGANVSQAIGDIVSRIWEKQKIPPNIVHTPLKDILLWSDRRL